MAYIQFLGAAGTVTEAPGANPDGLPAHTGVGPVPEDPAGSAAASSAALASSGSATREITSRASTSGENSGPP